MVCASHQGVMRVFLAFVLFWAAGPISSLEAKSFRSPVCVSFSEIRQMGRDLSFHLSGQSLRKANPEIALKKRDDIQEMREWYELVRVGHRAVLLQVNF
jgi:hypothetical protein